MRTKAQQEGVFTSCVCVCVCVCVWGCLPMRYLFCTSCHSSSEHVLLTQVRQTNVKYWHYSEATEMSSGWCGWQCFHFSALFSPILACISQSKARLYSEGCDLLITVNIRMNSFREMWKRLIFATSVCYLSAFRVIEISAAVQVRIYVKLNLCRTAMYKNI